MKAIETLKAKLEAVGATLDAGEYSLHCDAPAGYVWVANGMPGYSIHYATNHQTWLMEALRLEMPSLRMGLRLATSEELVEIDWNNGDEHHRAPVGSPEFITFPKPQ